MLCHKCFKDLQDEEEEDLWAFLCTKYYVSKQKGVNFIDCVELSRIEKKGYVISTECNHFEEIVVKVKGFKKIKDGAKVCCKAVLHGTD
jgi:hypothetical protein